MSYIIKKNGKRYNSKSYTSYEDARSYLRKKLRTFKDDNLIMEGDGNDNAWLIYNNPSHSRYGFKIEKRV
jgi:hypothetical protein